MKIHLTKPTAKQVRHFLIYCLIVVAGNFIASAASAYFIVPHEFVMGGTTGVGIFVRNLLPEGESTEWAVTVTVYIANIALFLVGAVFLGKRFAAATLAGTLLYPTFMALHTKLNELYVAREGHIIAEGDPLLAVLFGALLFGFGIGMVVRVGASTGGTDIPPLILNKLFGIPIVVTMWTLDITIVLIQLFAGVTLETVLYGILITLIAALIVDVVSPIGMKRMQVKIVSRHYAEIREVILTELNRGVTILYGKTGFLQEECFVLLTVVSNRELVRLKNAVHKIDPNAFMMISVISEVRGRGFSSEKVAYPRTDAPCDLHEVSPEQFVWQKKEGPQPSDLPDISSGEPVAPRPPQENREDRQ